MDRKRLLQLEVYGRDRIEAVTFWFVRDDAYDRRRIRHSSMVTEIILEVIRTHEAVDTGYPFVVGTRDYTRNEALEFVQALARHISISRELGNSDYVIEWWSRCTSDAGRDNLIISIAPPGLYELSR